VQLTREWAQAVLLDLYDTLVQPDWKALQATRDRMAELVGVPAALAAEHWRRTHSDRMLGAHGSLEGDLAAVFAASGAQPEPALLREMVEQEFASWAAGVRLFDDVEPNLRRLRDAGLRLAIVSNASCEAASVVQTLGLDRWVDTVVMSCEEGSLKPEPTLLRVALSRLDTDARRAVFLDDMSANLDAAAALGMMPVRVARYAGAASADAGTAPYPCITTLDDLWPYLDSFTPPIADETRAGS
jgi:FMN phosphatase YigB (HAD superfamily)